MYGYTAQQTYGNYGNYVQNNFATPVTQQQTGQMAGGATSSTYGNTDYTYPTGASAYTPYSQSVTQVSAPLSYQKPQSTFDYNTDYFKAASAAAGYGGAAATSSTNARPGNPAILGIFNAKPTTNMPMGGASNSVASSHYSGYEAAVYAAANTYLQNSGSNHPNHQWTNTKHSGGAMEMGVTSGNKFQTNKYPNKFAANKYPKGGNMQMSGAFQKKRYGLGHQNRDITTHYCEVCKVSCGGSQTYKEHLEGKLHKKKEAMNRGDSVHSLPRLKVSFKCDVCNVTCTGRDTYEAHAKGVKHQKTVALLKKMNKPIPALEPTLIPPKEGLTPTTTGASKKIVGVTGAKFVAGSKLSTTNGGGAEADSTAAVVEQALLAESNVKPVGEEFIEEQRDGTGKLIQYSCKLCECKFSDPNAKEIHLKGRRHRLQYKQKVNPSLEVETKATGSYGRKQLHQMRRAQALVPPQPLRHFLPPPMLGMGVETSEDRHVIAKVNAIQMSKAEHDDVDKLVTTVEKALKAISDKLAEEDQPAPAAEAKGDGDKPTETPVEPERLLKGVMRVGLLAKNLLLKTDKEVDLVVLCSKIPTKTLLCSIEQLFPQYLQKNEKETVNITAKPTDACIFVKLSGIPYTCRITLTCVLVRDAQNAKTDGSATKESSIQFPADALPTEPCLKALAELRHAKWYQVKCSPLSSINMTLKIVRDISARIPTWASLSTWTMELLAEKALSSINIPLSPGDAVRRLFETIAGGVILDKSPTLIDPCEKDTVDLLSQLKNQEREDITASAQHALRLISFNQLYKILCIDRIPDRPILPHGGERKRPRESNGLSADGSSDAKKEKKDDDGIKKETSSQ